MQIENIEKWVFYKHKIRELNQNNEDMLNPYLNEILQLLIFLNQNKDDIKKILDQNYSFYLDDFFNSISKQLILTCKQTVASLELNNLILKQIVKLFLNTFLFQDNKLYESFYLILDPRRNYHKYQNQDSQILSHKYHLEQLNQDNNFLSKLKINQQIDAIQKNNELMQWQQAKILKIKHNKFKIQYLDNSERWIYKDSGEIALFKSQTKESLPQLNQFIDFYTQQGYWVNAKIIFIQNDIIYTVNYIDNEQQIQQENCSIFSCRFLPSCYVSSINKFEENIEDSNDNILQNFEILVIGREQICQSRFLINLLNKSNKYFDQLIQSIHDSNNIEYVKIILQFFENINKLVLKSQAIVMFEKIQKAVIHSIIQISLNNVRNQQSQIIDNIINSLLSLLQRIYSQEQKDNIIMQFQLDIILIYINSNYLERQIQALKLISDIQKSFKQNELLENWIVKNNIFEQINNKKCHIQLLQRQYELIKIMLDLNLFSDQNLLLLLSYLSKNDIEYKISLYKLIKDISQYLNQQQIQIIVDKIFSIQIDILQIEDIDLIYFILNKQKDVDYTQFIQFIWNVINSENIKNQVIQECIDKLMKIVSNWNYNEIKQQYLIKAINLIQDNINTIYMIQIIRQMIETYPTFMFLNQNITRQMIILQLVQDQNLLQILINDLINYKRQNQIDIKQLIERIVFIYKIIQQLVQKNIDIFDYIQILYDINVSQQKIDQERDMFFTFLSNLQQITDNQQINQFFQEKILDSQNFTFYRTQQLNFFKKIFIKNNFLQNQNNEIQIDVLPNKLKQIELFWEIYFNVEDVETKNQVQQFLIEIYSNVNHIYKKWVSQKQQSLQLFIQTCLQYLEFYDQEQTRVRIIDLIQQFMYDSESYGIGNLQSHFQPLLISLIKINIINDFNYFQEKFTIKIEDNLTLIDLRIEIAKKAKCCWEQIEIQQMKNQILLKDQYNGITLKELDIQNMEKLQINRKQQQEVQQAQLIINDELNPKLVQIFSAWFEEFSFDGKMYPNDCAKFINSCTGDLCDGEDKRIKELYYQWDENSKGYLDLNDFLQFYKDACEKKQRVVWSNLQNKNFKNDLTKISDQQVKQIQEQTLVRYYLMNNEQFFEIMFKLKGNYQLELLNKIPTSQHIYDNILKNLKDFNINDYEGIRQLYYLQTIHEILKNNNVIINNDQFIQLYNEKYQSDDKIDKLKVVSIFNIIKSQFKQDNILNLISNQKYSLESLNNVFIDIHNIELLELIDNNNLIKNNIYSTNDYELFMVIQQLIVLYISYKNIDFDQQYINLLFINNKIIRTAVHKVIYLATKLNNNKQLQALILQYYINNDIKHKFSKQFYQLIYMVVEQDNENIDKVQQISVSKLELGIQTTYNMQILSCIIKKNRKIQINLINLFKSFFQNCDIKNTDKQNLFELSLLIIQDNQEQSLIFIQQVILPMLQNLKTNDEYGFMQDQNNFRSSANYVGIKNPGCICYMNAMLQQFFMIPIFRRAILLSDDNKQNIMVEYNKQKYIDDNILHQIQNIFGYLQESIQEDFDPYGFCFSFKDYDGNPTNIKIQQDAQEFLNLLFDRLETQLKNTPYCKLIENVFGGQTCTTFTCSFCKNKIQRFESFNNLSLDIKNLKNLQDSFNQFIQEEQIQDYFCNQCQEKQDVGKTVTISSCPNYLILHLKRIIFDFETFENEKINSQFDFQNAIDISQYCEQKEQQQNYDLVGILVHIGVAQFGHYISYIKNQEGNWFEFNDSIVTDFDPNNIEKQCFGGNKSMNFNDFNFNNKSAYMLIYEKRQKSDFIMSQLDEKNKQLFQKIKQIDDNNYSVNFDDFPQQMATELQQQIQDSNQQFILLKNIYNQQFYLFLDQILNQLHDSELSDQQLLDILETYYLFILKIISRSKITQNIEQISQKAIKFLNKHKNLALEMCTKISQYEYIAELFIKSNDKNVRTAVKNLISQSIILLFKNDNVNKEDFINNQFFSLCQIFLYSKNCLKLQQYFEFMIQMTNIQELCKFMIQRKILNQLLKFIIDLQSYMNIELCLDLILQLLQKSDIKDINIGYLQDLFEKLFQTYKEEYIKDYLIPITFQISYKDYKNTILMSGIIIQALYDLSQEKIQIIFQLIKFFLKINDQYQQLRIELIMGCPNFKNITFNNKQNNQLIYEFISPLIIQRSSTFLDILLSQKNKYNILKYFVFLFKMIIKNDKFSLFIKNLPSPNIMCRSFLDWINALLAIIQKESGKIWQFEFEDDLNKALQLYQTIKQYYKQDHEQYPQYVIEKLNSLQQNIQQNNEIKIKYQDYLTQQRYFYKQDEDPNLQNNNTLRVVYISNESNSSMIVNLKFQQNAQIIPYIQDIIVVLQPNQSQKIVTFQKIHLDTKFQEFLQIKTAKIDLSLNEILNIHQNLDKLHDLQ